MNKLIKLKEIAKPQIEIENKDGKIITIDVFGAYSKITDKFRSDNASTMSEQTAIVNSVLELTLDDAEAATIFMAIEDCVTNYCKSKN